VLLGFFIIYKSAYLTISIVISDIKKKIKNNNSLYIVGFMEFLSAATKRDENTVEKNILLNILS